MSYFPELMTNEERIEKAKLRKIVVSVKTQYYRDANGCYIAKKVMRPLKKQCGVEGLHLLEDYISGEPELSIEEILGCIEKDGDYELLTIWHLGSWEYPEDGELEWQAQKIKP